MENYRDVQYFANISVGGQQITGIIDTGSFELVVFESHCAGCGRAALYNSDLSNKFSKGPLSRGLFYGSGDIYAREAFDQVEIGPFTAVNQSFWEAYEASMPVLHQARFQSIIGVGPPEMPSAEAWKETKKSVEGILDTINTKGSVQKWQTDKVLNDLNFSMEISIEPVMLNSYNITLFSLCLLNPPGSSGYFVWNDTTVLEQPSFFKRVQILGRHTWAIGMTNVRVAPRWPDAEPIQIACNSTCGAIVDSGTSLIMMPSQVVTKLESTLQHMGATDCRYMQDLPDLVFTLDGHTFSLPPDAFLSEVDEIPQYMESFARVRNLLPEQVDGCKLLVMESYSTSELGPLWILGMPFFRRYYTTFNVGATHEDRSLYVAPASADCYPEEPSSSLARSSQRETFRRRLPLSQMYLPPIVKKAAEGGFMSL